MKITRLQVSRDFLKGSVAVAFMVCVGSAVAQTEIPVVFDDSGCPVAGSVPPVDTQRGRKLTWQARNQAGENTRESFMIYFDPLQGATLKAPQGKVSKPIDRKAPLVEYKYTIVSGRCENQPEDPIIRVNN